MVSAGSGAGSEVKSSLDRSGYVKSCLARLGQVRLGQVRLGKSV